MTGSYRILLPVVATNRLSNWAAGRTSTEGEAERILQLVAPTTLRASPLVIRTHFEQCLPTTAPSPLRIGANGCINSAVASPLVIRTDLSHCISPSVPTALKCNTHAPVSTAGTAGLPARYQLARLIPRASQGFWRLNEVLS